MTDSFHEVGSGKDRIEWVESSAVFGRELLARIASAAEVAFDEGGVSSSWNSEERVSGSGSISDPTGEAAIRPNFSRRASARGEKQLREAIYQLKQAAASFDIAIGVKS